MNKPRKRFNWKYKKTGEVDCLAIYNAVFALAEELPSGPDAITEIIFDYLAACHLSEEDIDLIRLINNGKM